MSGANYAHCNSKKCLQSSTKTLYIGEYYLPDDCVIYHKECLEYEIKENYTKNEDIKQDQALREIDIRIEEDNKQLLMAISQTGVYLRETIRERIAELQAKKDKLIKGVGHEQ